VLDLDGGVQCNGDVEVGAPAQLPRQATLLSRLAADAVGRGERSDSAESEGEPRWPACAGGTVNAAKRRDRRVPDHSTLPDCAIPPTPIPPIATVKATSHRVRQNSLHSRSPRRWPIRAAMNAVPGEHVVRDLAGDGRRLTFRSRIHVSSTAARPTFGTTRSRTFRFSTPGARGRRSDHARRSTRAARLVPQAADRATLAALWAAKQDCDEKSRSRGGAAKLRPFSTASRPVLGR
jgi:hypothetical protein